MRVICWLGSRVEEKWGAYVALGSSNCLGGGSPDDQGPGQSHESRIRRCIWLCLGSPSSFSTFDQWWLLSELSVGESKQLTEWGFWAVCDGKHAGERKATVRVGRNISGIWEGKMGFWFRLIYQMVPGICIFFCFLLAGKKMYKMWFS